MGFEDDMKDYEDTYAGTEAAAQPGIFSDGKHQAHITVARIITNEKYGGYQWEVQFSGVDTSTGRPANVRLWENVPPSDARAEYLKKNLLTLGYTGPLYELEKACIAGFFIGKVCDIVVVTKVGVDRDYKNVYINRYHPDATPVDLPESSSDEGFGPGPDGDDDIPF